jgi:hypothetical protein
MCNRLELLFFLISTHCDIGEVVFCVECDQRSKPMKCVWCDVRHRLDFILQLILISMEDDIGLPLLVHVTRVPQRIELHGQWFEAFYIQKSGTSGSSQVMKVMSMRNQLKWNSYPWSCACLQSSSIDL